LQTADSELPAREHEAARGDMALLVAHLHAAYNLTRCFMRTETDPEDLVQEAYVRAFTHFAGFRGGDGRAWLLAIVRKGGYDRLIEKRVREQNAAFDEAVHSDRQVLNPETSFGACGKGRTGEGVAGGIAGGVSRSVGTP
jgi:RNA polymerase sigma-70 factor, ECF subfamily